MSASTGQARAHIHPLTGIRGLASFWVLLHHAPNLHPLGALELGPASNFIEKGWLGVDLFFVLSGFVISYVYARKMRTFGWAESVRFWKLRLARVYPAHVAATLVFVPIYLVAHFGLGYTSPQDAFSLRKLAFALSLTNGWGIPDSAGWNQPSWSVSSEWFAYLLFPVLTLGLSRLRSAWANALGIVLTLSLMVGLAVALNDARSFTLDWQYTLSRIGSEFVIGCLLFNIYRRAKDHRAFDALAISSLAGIVVLSLWGLPGFYDFVLIGLFATLILGLARSQGVGQRVFGSRPLVYLGEISYSVYLIHSVLILLMGQLGQRIWPNVAPTWALGATFMAYVTASLLAGHLLFRFVEVPARSWLRTHWIR